MAIPDLPLGVRLLIYVGTIPAMYLFFYSLSWFLDYIAVDRYVDAYRQEEGFDSGALAGDDTSRPPPRRATSAVAGSESAAADAAEGADATPCLACGMPTETEAPLCEHCDGEFSQ